MHRAGTFVLCGPLGGRAPQEGGRDAPQRAREQHLQGREKEADAGRAHGSGLEREKSGLAGVLQGPVSDRVQPPHRLGSRRETTQYEEVSASLVRSRAPTQRPGRLGSRHSVPGPAAAEQCPGTTHRPAVTTQNVSRRCRSKSCQVRTVASTEPHPQTTAVSEPAAPGVRVSGPAAGGGDAGCTLHTADAPASPTPSQRWGQTCW